MSDYTIGEAETRRLIIKSDITGNEVNIANIVTHIFIYEDLFSHSLTSNIAVADGTSLLNNLPIVGGEVVDIDVGEMGDGARKLRTKLIVSAISDKTRVKPDLEVYTLNLVTAEYLSDASISVDRSYTGQISDMIKQVVEEYITPITGKELITVEETKGIQTMTSTGITPIAFIRQLMREAESMKNAASIYMFYETIEGYHFITLDELYNEQEVSHSFIYDEISQSETTSGGAKRAQNNIAYLNVESTVDLMKGQASGQYASVTREFDPLTKTYKSNTYDYAKDKKQTSHDDKTLGSAATKKYMGNPTKSRFFVTDSHRRDTPYIIKNEPRTQNNFRRRQDFAAREEAVLKQFGAMRISASVPGNSQVSIGQTVNIIVPKADDTEQGKKKNDAQISGKYIITAVAHNIDNTSGEYATIMECMRPGFEERII